MILLGISCIQAQDIFSANDLDPANVIETKIFGTFNIAARNDKNVTIEVLDVPREAPDGEIFNNRIKLNGSGSADYRSLNFSIDQKRNLIIYCNSSSKTDTRILVLYDVKNGKTIAEFNADPDNGTKAAVITTSLSSAGTYALYSKSGGINIYQIVLK
jgi:hypothetical protein